MKLEEWFHTSLNLFENISARSLSERFLGRKNANIMKIDFCHSLFVIQNALAKITRKTQKITKVDPGVPAG